MPESGIHFKNGLEGGRSAGWPEMRRAKAAYVSLAVAATVLAGVALPALCAEPPGCLRGEGDASPGESVRGDAAAPGSGAAGLGAALPDHQLSHLAQNAQYAIRGTVTGIAGVPPQDGDLSIYVFVDVAIAVEEDLFGKYAEKTITVRTRRAAADGAAAAADGAPGFRPGERVLVLVAAREPDGIYRGSHYVAGKQYGKYSLDGAGNALNEDTSRNTSYEALRDVVAAAPGADPGATAAAAALESCHEPGGLSDLAGLPRYDSWFCEAARGLSAADPAAAMPSYADVLAAYADAEARRYLADWEFYRLHADPGRSR